MFFVAFKISQDKTNYYYELKITSRPKVVAIPLPHQRCHRLVRCHGPISVHAVLSTAAALASHDLVRGHDLARV